MFVVFYGAGDALLGIATGILARGAGDLSTEVREGRAEVIAMLFEDPVANVLYFVGELGWLVGLLAAVVALYAGGSPRFSLVLLVLSGCVLLVFDHPAPYGPIVFGSFFLGVLWLELTRGRRSVTRRRTRDTAPCQAGGGGQARGSDMGAYPLQLAAYPFDHRLRVPHGLDAHLGLLASVSELLSRCSHKALC